MDKDELIKFIVIEDLKFNIIKAMNYYGIEGTEEKIKELYVKMPKARDIMLTEYYKLIRDKYEF